MAATLVGQKLGKYEITQLLGHGGMATVYKGYQRDIDRYVAVKVLPPHPGQNSQYVERFRLEARTIARLQHPHILPLYDYGDENGVLYLVMAYADGGSLNDRIRQGALPLNQALRIFEQVASALDYAHRQNVVHRDVKPDNILLDDEGHALLTDFGIVKIIEGTPGTNLTGTGGLVGTPAYMSPEQAQGLPVDNRTDIYSLGIVVYEMLSGKQPFSADTPMQLVLKHITAPVPSLSSLVNGLPPELDGVMGRALAKEPGQRYRSANDFYQDFTRVARGDQPLTPAQLNLQPVPPTEQPTQAPAGTVGTAQLQPTVVTPPAWNPLVLLGGFAIIALLVVAVVALLLNFTRQDGSQAVVPTLASLAEQPTIAAPVANTTTPTFGKVSFSTTQNMGDTVGVQVNDLTAPRDSQSYNVWLENTKTHSALKLGSLRLDALGDGQLAYSDASAALPVLYNAVVLTLGDGEGATPSGTVAYSGSVPFEVMDALYEILITSPDGIPPAPPTTPDAYATLDVYASPTPASSTQNTSLLEGALEEATIAQKHAGLAADATTVGSLHTHAEHTINILNGTYVDYNGNGRGENPGHGYGIAYFTDRIDSKLEAVANAPTSNNLIQSQIELMRVCIVNTRNWMNQVIGLESQMLSASDLVAVHPQLVQATNYAADIVSGTDLNGNGQVEPFEGECGLQQINTYGISVGNINIVAGPLSQGE